MDFIPAIQHAEKILSSARQTVVDITDQIAFRRARRHLGEQEYPVPEQDSDQAGLAAAKQAVAKAESDLAKLKTAERDAALEPQRRRVAAWVQERDEVRKRMNELGPKLLAALQLLEEHIGEFGLLERAENEILQRSIRHNTDSPATAVEMPDGPIQLTAPPVQTLQAILARIRI